MKAKFTSLGLILLFMAGCAGVPPVNCVALGRGSHVCLLPPAQLPALDGAHMITVDHNGKRQMFIGQLHIDSHVIRLAGSSLFGPSLFTVSYDGDNLHSEPVDGRQRADLLIAVLEMVAASQRTLQPALQGLTLTQTTATDGKRLREFFERGHLVVRIEMSAAPLTQAVIRFDIPSANLSVLMQPLASQAALQP